MRRFHGRRTICVVSRRVVRGWVMMWSAIAKARSISSAPRHDLVDQAVLQRLGGVDRLAGEQRVGGALDAEQLLEGVVDAVGGHRADVVVEVEQHGVFAADRDVAHQDDLGVEAGAVEQPDRRDLEVVDQRADVDPPVLVGVLVCPVVHVLVLEREPVRDRWPS